MILLPHKFYDGKIVSPSSMNANMLAVQEACRKLENKRFHRFSVLVPFHTVDDSEADEAKFFLYLNEASYTLERVELVLESLSSLSTYDVTLTSDIDGFVDLGFQLFEASSGDKFYDSQTQNCLIESGVEYEFTISAPAAGKSYSAYMVLHCRYDCMQSHDLQAMPSIPFIKDGDSWSAVELQSWHTSMDSYIDSLLQSLVQRRSFMVLSPQKDTPSGTTPSSASGQMRIASPMATFEHGTLYAFHSHGAGLSAILTTALRVISTATSLWTESLTVGTSGGVWSSDNSAASGSVDEPFDINDLELQVTNLNQVTRRMFAIIEMKGQ